MADVIPNKAQEAVDFLHEVQTVESENRTEGLEDLKFRFGDQWQAIMTKARGDRPQLTVNETDAYVRQIVNELRQQRPRIKAYAANTLAQKKTADIVTGLMRHIQVNSDADNAYDTAGEFAVTMGWGYWRVLTDWVREDSFDQDIYIKQVENPFSVYFDPQSIEPDGSDAEKCLVTDTMRLEAFKREFPDAQTTGFVATSTGDDPINWVNGEDIRIAEMFEVERTKAKLVALSNGTAMWDDELKPDIVEALRVSGITIRGDRASYKRVVRWRKVSAFETLEEKVWPGRWIPIVPTYGAVMVVGGKKIRLGAVRFARDPQRMVNYWQSGLAESIAMAVKAKWLMAEGQDEGHEAEWAGANNLPYPLLRYKPTDVEGKPAPPPQRVQPEPPPEGIIAAAMAASQNLQRVMGMFDPDTNVKGPKSGRARDAEANQSERSNYHFYDNQTRSMKHTGRICLDLFKPIYDRVGRVQTIIGEDGKPDVVTLNEAQAIGAVLNDVRVGEYGVIMDVGPGYNSKRQEAAERIGQILQGNEKLMDEIGDLYFRNCDFPGAEVIADRLAAKNPLAQLDEKSDVPPQAQMMIKNLQQKVEQLMKALQAAGVEIKTKQGIEAMRQDGETKRALMKETAHAHDVEVTAATRRHDVETRALTAMDVQGLKSFTDLILTHIDTRRLQMEIEQRDREVTAKSTEAEVAETPSPAPA